MSPAAGPAPRIVVTLRNAARQAEPGIAVRKNALYVDSVVRHGAAAIALDPGSSASERAAAIATMDGLLLTGGPDLDPSRYGAAEPRLRGHGAGPRRAGGRRLGRRRRARHPGPGHLPRPPGDERVQRRPLLQHVDGHAGHGWGHGPALTHPLRLVPGTRLARILSPSGVGGNVLTVNSYHHQAVRAADLSPRYVPAAWSPSPAGDLVEAFEGREGPFRMAVQCHPERTESTPKAFERLFSFFVDACRGPLLDR